MRGGYRENAGRKKNDVQTVCYHRRVKPEWVKLLDLVLQRLKEDSSKIKNFAHNLGADMRCHNMYECDGTLDCSECEKSEFFFDD